MAMVNLTIKVNLKPSKRNELLSSCKLIVTQTLKKKGCINQRICQDLDDDSFIRLDTSWENRGLLDEYFRSDVFNALMGAVKFLGESHEVIINDGSRNEGMEAVIKAQSIMQTNAAKTTD